MATLITNVTELQAMENDLSAWYELANDIDASDTINWNGGLGFDPVGDSTIPFTGNFDGKGFKITNLFINRSASGWCFVGMFGMIGVGGVVKNFELRDCDITATVTDRYAYVGAVARRNAGTIDNVSVTGGTIRAVAGYRYADAGGLVQTNRFGTIIRSRISSSIITAEATDAYADAAGLAVANWGTIQGCYVGSDVSITATTVNHADAGGLVQDNTGVINDSYSRGSVEAIATTSFANAAGLVDHNRGGAIDNCYSTGLVVATSPGSKNTGGLVGSNTGTVTDSFWDTQTSGQATSAGGIGKTTAEMTTSSTFIDAGWDFATIWTRDDVTNDKYPYLWIRLRPFTQGQVIG